MCVLLQLRIMWVDSQKKKKKKEKPLKSTSKINKLYEKLLKN